MLIENISCISGRSCTPGRRAGVAGGAAAPSDPARCCLPGCASLQQPGGAGGAGAPADLEGCPRKAARRMSTEKPFSGPSGRVFCWPEELPWLRSAADPGRPWPLLVISWPELLSWKACRRAAAFMAARTLFINQSG